MRARDRSAKGSIGDSPPVAYEYDAFLSYAKDDGTWCERLAEALRNHGVRVWFDQWQIQPGDHLLRRINDALERSRKVVSVWSPSYFRDDKVWTVIEAYAGQHADVLAQDRPLVPLLLEACKVPPTLASLVHLDFRNPDDFELGLRKLLQALDLPSTSIGVEERRELGAHEPDLRERVKLAGRPGKRFEEEVATLYRLLGYEVTRDVEVAGMQIDLRIEKREGGFLTRGIVECKDKRVTATERAQILAQQNVAQRTDPKLRWIAVSSSGFAPDTRVALETAGVDCTTYPDLLRELVPLERYADALIRDYEDRIADPELAGQMWTDVKTSFSTPEIVALVSRLHAARALDFGDQEVDDIAREVQTASFLRRDHKGERGGDFHFIQLLRRILPRKETPRLDHRERGGRTGSPVRGARHAPTRPQGDLLPHPPGPE